MYPSLDVASDLSFYKFINCITKHRKLANNVGGGGLSQEVYHFLKEKNYNHIRSLLISTDNFFFWNKCSLYAYQTQPLPSFNGINFPVMYNLSY